MAPYTPSTSLLSPGRIGQAAWVAALLAGSVGRSEGPPLTPAQATEIVACYHEAAPPLTLNPDLALAQGVVETACYTSALWRERRNPCGLGITGPGVLGKDYGTVRNGIVAHLHHLCCYAYTLATCPVPHVGTPDPRHTFHDGNPRLSHLQDATRRWAEEPGYVGKIVAILNALPQETSMAVKDYPSPNFGYPRGEHGRSGHKVVALTIHIMDGTLAGTRSWFASTASQASATRGLGRDGVSMDRYVQEGDAPWTNGDIQGPDLSIPWLREAIAKGINPNELTETLECEGRSGEPWPEAQYQGILAWVRERTAALGITPTRDTVIGHYRLNSVTRANCPGKNFPWDRLFHDLGTGYNLSDPAKSLMLKAAWAKGRQIIGDAGLPDPYGLMLYEAVADLTGIVATLPKAARCLVCEKAALWIGGAGVVDSFHRGQYEALEASGKAQKLV